MSDICDACGDYTYLDKFGLCLSCSEALDPQEIDPDPVDPEFQPVPHLAPIDSRWAPDQEDPA